jgi:hypothetical protein
MATMATSAVRETRGRCFHVRTTGEHVHIRIAKDMGIALFHCLVNGMRDSVINEPMEGDLQLLSLANLIEAGLDIPEMGRIGMLTLPRTCELSGVVEQLERFSDPEVWESWPDDCNFCQDFAELTVALTPIMDDAPCICPPDEATK